MSNQVLKDPVAIEQRTNHIGMLMERVLQVARWPHYQLLLDDLMELADQDKWDGKAKILSLERTLLYGGKSLFAPIFYGHDYRIREASPESAYERGPYNADMVGPQFMEYGKPSSGHANTTEAFDLCLVPNAVHHMPLHSRANGQHGDFFGYHIKNILRPGGYLYIFEQCIEEIHQKPDDYVRYTPDGLASLLKAVGYQIEWVRTIGNVFTSAAFLLDVALEYIEGTPAPEGTKPLDFGMTKGEDIRKVSAMIDRLKGMAPHYHTTARKYTECPKAFSILVRKPA
jgi:hypothetical protein